jgi:hypothetical protein
MDQPARALDLVYRYTRGLSFADDALPSPWAEERKDSISKEVGDDGRAKPMDEPPGEVAQRLRREGFVGFLLGFVAICALAVVGSVVWQWRWGMGGGRYEGIREGAAMNNIGEGNGDGPWPSALGRGLHV